MSDGHGDSLTPANTPTEGSTSYVRPHSNSQPQPQQSRRRNSRGSLTSPPTASHPHPTDTNRDPMYPGEYPHGIPLRPVSERTERSNATGITIRTTAHSNVPTPVWVPDPSHTQTHPQAQVQPDPAQAWSMNSTAPTIDAAVTSPPAPAETQYPPLEYSEPPPAPAVPARLSTSTIAHAYPTIQSDAQPRGQQTFIQPNAGHHPPHPVAAVGHPFFQHMLPYNAAAGDRSGERSGGWRSPPLLPAIFSKARRSSRRERQEERIRADAHAQAHLQAQAQTLGHDQQHAPIPHIQLQEWEHVPLQQVQHGHVQQAHTHVHEIEHPVPRRGFIPRVVQNLGRGPLSQLSGMFFDSSDSGSEYQPSRAPTQTQVRRRRRGRDTSPDDTANGNLTLPTHGTPHPSARRRRSRGYRHRRAATASLAPPTPSVSVPPPYRNVLSPIPEPPPLIARYRLALSASKVHGRPLLAAMMWGPHDEEGRRAILAAVKKVAPELDLEHRVPRALNANQQLWAASAAIEEILLEVARRNGEVPVPEPIPPPATPQPQFRPPKTRFIPLACCLRLHDWSDRMEDRRTHPPQFNHAPMAQPLQAPTQL